MPEEEEEQTVENAVPDPAPPTESEPVAASAPAAARRRKAAKKKPAAKTSQKPKAAKAVKPASKKSVKTVAKKSAKPAAQKAAKPAAAKTATARTKPAAKSAAKPAAQPQPAASAETATLLSSKVVYQGPLFRVLHDKLIEPNGKQNERDVIRHNGSVVILAVDKSKSKKNPWIVIERQYRHAANQYLWELPAGKLDAGEDALAGAQRELAEETGYSAKKWKPLVEYFASPGFLGESMKVFLAEGLIAGDAHPEEDEQIEFRLVKLSEILDLIEEGAIKDGKTLTSILLYARKLKAKGKR